MNGSFLLISMIIFFLAAYRFYGYFLLHIFKINPNRKTPAHRYKDGIDYHPTHPLVVFGHHFASIAGAGPIVGPALALTFGWLPVLIWILFGSVFIGAFHDVAAMILSVRNQGKSIGYIIEKYISFTGKQLYLTFCCLALILVVAIFAILIAKTFVSSPAVATASLLFILIAVVFGALTHIKVLSFKVATLIFIPIIFLIAIKSASFPLDLTRFGVPQNYVYPIWLTVLFLYAFIASITPVWSLLQPRDYLSSFLLYTMIILGIGGIFISSPKIIIPAFTSFTAPEPINGATQWSLFPLLFVIVACGACSGFHALVASGTTSKQIDLKRHILPIGYGGMLLEGLLAGITLISVGVYTRSEYFTALYKIGPINAFAGAIARFISNLGLPAQASETFIALTIAAFMMTTLDTATRVTRLTFQELFDFSKNKGKNKFLFLISGFLKAPLTATLIVVALSAYMAFSGEGDKIWPVFGASNQLMAALTLLTITAFFLKTKRKVWVALIPFVIMLIMSCWGLVELFLLNIKASNIPLVVVTSFLLNMTVLLVMQTSIELLCFRKKIVRRKIRSKNTDNLIATGL
jgi:carbon starvation protein